MRRLKDLEAENVLIAQRPLQPGLVHELHE